MNAREVRLRIEMMSALAGSAGLLPGDRSTVDVLAVEKLGEAAAATERFERLRGTPHDVERPWFVINDAINVCIAAGLYREALDWPKRWSAGWLAKARAYDSESWVLVQINLAEAHYNLGDWDAAWACLAGLDDHAARAPITRAGLFLQRAWIHARHGDGAGALELVRAARIEDLPANYRTEHHFTRAVALLACARHDEALRAVADGCAIAMRPSSRRNASFLAARINVAAERWSEGEEQARAGAEHRYRWQGGDGLLLWGDVLARMGREAEARHAWRRAIAQDPQSGSAALAEKRVGLGEPPRGRGGFGTRGG